MNLKNALWMGVAVYIIPFVIAALVSSATDGTAISPSTTGGLIGLSVTIVILVLFSLKYLKTVMPSAKEGLMFGIVAGIIGLAIDTIIVISLDVTRPVGNLANPLFWFAILFVIIVATMVGLLKGKKADKA